MNAAVTVDDLLPATPAAQSVTPTPAASNVTTGSFTKGLRPQDVALNLYLRGQSPQEIAIALGGAPEWTDELVVKLIESEWAQKQIDKINAAEQTSEGIDKLLVAHSFRAVVRLGKIISGPSDMLALQACKLVLSHAHVPISRTLVPSQPASLSEEEVKRRLAFTQRVINQALDKRLKSA